MPLDDKFIHFLYALRAESGTDTLSALQNFIMAGRKLIYYTNKSMQYILYAYIRSKIQSKRP